ASICGRCGSIAKSFREASSLTPLRTSRSRRPATGVSIVTTSAENFAARARSIDAIAASRPPSKYSWYQTAPPDAAAPSSSHQPDRAAAVVALAARQRGERVDRPNGSGDARGHFLAARIEQPAAADGREDDRH